MKSLDMFIAMVAATLFSVATARAGQDGNGGFGVLCRAPVKTESGTQLPAGLYTLDHFEGLNDPELTWDLGPASLTWQQKIDLVAKRVRRFNFELSADLEELAKNPRKFVRISDVKVYCSNTKLVGGVAEYTPDYGSVILPGQCDLVPVARNIASCGALGDKHPLVFIFEGQFNRMGNDSQAAIVLHEYLYSKYRNRVTEGDSTRLRNFVGLVASRELQTLDLKSGLKLFIDQGIVPVRVEIPGLPGWYLKVGQKAQADLYDLDVRTNSDGSKTIAYSGAALVTRQAPVQDLTSAKTELYEVLFPNASAWQIDHRAINVGADGHIEEQFLVEESDGGILDLQYPSVRFGRKVFSFELRYGGHQALHQQAVEKLAKLKESGGNLMLGGFQDGDLEVRSSNGANFEMFNFASEPGFVSYCLTVARHFATYGNIQYKGKNVGNNLQAVCKSRDGVITVMSEDAEGKRRYIDRLGATAQRTEIFGRPVWEGVAQIDPENYVTDVEQYNTGYLAGLGLTGTVKDFINMRLHIVKGRPVCGQVTGYSDLAIVMNTGRTFRPYKSWKDKGLQVQVTFDSDGKVDRVEPLGKQEVDCSLK